MSDKQRLRVHVTGVVQGVGFRPFVWKLAHDLGLAGWVRNDTAGVVTEVEGASADLESFVAALRSDAPALARVDGVSATAIPVVGESEFTLQVSDLGGRHRVLVSADAATCDDCLAEVNDPTARRYGYAFGSCTHCGPRYTIVLDVPYDRARTTMASFPLCADCLAEYDDPSDRRYHAQPICCPACGPELSMSVAAAATVLRRGEILAVKGLGGYHLAVLATDETAVARLRARKHREDRPFALMVPTLAAVHELCALGPLESELLTSVAAPIVLLARRAGSSGVAASVAPGQQTLGVMLPYTPLHHLLLAELDAPLVMTSGNRSDEPIAHLDPDARERLAGIADAFLTHNRPIETRVDDSVVKVVRDRVVPIRRSRGHVPGTLRLPFRLRREVLACGAQLKNTFALGREELAFVSHHVGDLDNWATYQSYERGIAHLSRLFEVTPELVVHDLHPDYGSSRYASGLVGVELVGVQHHHAHIASCLVDNGSVEPVIGVAFDGTGLGADGTIWGGEVLRADLFGFERVGHLRPVPLPGGDAAVREPWRMAAAYLREAFGDDVPDLPLRHHAQWAAVSRLAGSGLSPLTSSAGRLFDAVAAVLGVRSVATYEGQAAIELEALACADEVSTYSLPLDGTVIDGVALVRSVVEDLAVGTAVGKVSARFHATLAITVAELCDLVRGDLTTVALSGGVWQNSLLLARTIDALTVRNFRVLTHRFVPCNDGGISLGQLAVAGAGDAS